MYAYAISAAFFSSCSLNPNLRGGGLYCGWIFFFSSYFFACVYECTSAHPMSFKTLAVFLLLLLMWWGWYGWMWWDDGVVWYFGWDNVLFLEFFFAGLLVDARADREGWKQSHSSSKCGKHVWWRRYTAVPYIHVFKLNLKHYTCTFVPLVVLKVVYCLLFWLF